MDSRMDSQWIARYRRQLTLEGFGMAAQQRLAGSHVVVIGAGGLGAPALLYLAAAGVGRITVIDDDVVELSNLHRQVIHTEATVGQPKVDSAAAALRARNSDVEIIAVRARVTEGNADELFAGADVVMDGTDNFAARYAASAACARAKIPHVWASILGFDAQLSVFWADHGPIYSDIFPAAPPKGSVPSCAEAGVIGAVVGLVGTAMALEVVKLLGQVGTPLVGTIAYYSGLDGRWEYIELANPDVGAVPDEEPAEPAAEQPWNPDYFMVDVREQHEFDSFHIPGARFAPLSGLREQVTPQLLEDIAAAQSAGQTVVVYCAAGVRSVEAIQRLQHAGAQQLYNLEGGINGWLDQQG